MCKVEEALEECGWAIRVHFEAAELRSRLDNLKEFLKGEEIGTLDPKAIELLHNQYGYMKDYYNTLLERLKV